MPPEPARKRTVAFIDGQNLFYASKKAFGYPYPNYDPKALAECLAAARGWSLTETFFYSGIPDPIDNPFWNHFWTAKLAVMGTRGVQTFSRALRYRNQTVRMPDGSATTILVGQENGARKVDQGCLRLSYQPDKRQSPRHQSNRMDQD
jgi:hypothetical protein